MIERLRGPRDERGVIAVVVALITCFMLIPIAAYAVDLGLQRVARTDAQSVADVVALDLSRQLDGRTYAELMSASPSLQHIADQSAAGSSSVGQGLKVDFELGTLNEDNFHPGTSSSNYFTPTSTGTDKPDAVRVTVSAKVGFTFIGGSGGVSRTAIGNAALHACVMMDSYAAAVRSSQSALLNGAWAISADASTWAGSASAWASIAPLSKILGTNLDTTVLGSSGILTADLSVLSFLDALKTNLHAGSVDEVLGMNVTAAQVVAAEIAALNADGAGLAAQALQSQIASHISSSATMTVSSLLGIPVGASATQGGSSAAGASLNPLDLAAAAVQVANGQSAVSLGVSTPPNLIGFLAQATVGTHPQRVCLGAGRTQMAQTSVLVTANLDKTVASVANSLTSLTNGLLGGVGALVCALPVAGTTCYTPLQISNVNVSASVDLARAAATVTGITCTAKDKADVTVAEESALAPATVTLTYTISTTKTVRPLIGAAVVTNLSSTVTTRITTEDPPDKTVTGTFSAPDDFTKVKPGPDSNLSVTNLTVAANAHTDVDGSLATDFGGVNSVTNNVNNLFVAPLLGTTVEPLLSSVTGALKSLLGVTIAGSTYQLLDPASCRNPRLAG